jgi:hypothetical protein
MLTLLMALMAFAFLYGFVWHDQPARERQDAEPGARKQKIGTHD